MKRKIVFLDIDGTIVDHQKKIPVQTVKAVRSLQENGVYVAIATGRAPFMFEDIRKRLNINSFISFNGQYVVFEGKTVYKNPLPLEQLAVLQQEAEESGHSLVFMTDKAMRASVGDDAWVTESLGTLKQGYPQVDPGFFRKQDIYQALLFCEAEAEENYRASHRDFRFIRWHDFSCDVLPGGGSKAVGIDRLIAASGLKVEDSFAFGDGLNDLEMIQHAGTGVAMGNAIPELKAVADYVTGKVDENGLADGLAVLELIQKAEALQES